MNKRNFASDNNAGIAPEILAAINQVNSGHVKAYGDDPYSESASKKFKDIFGENSETFLVFNGTGANVLSLKSMTSSYNSVICSENAHINYDECNAPEFFTGCKLLTIKTQDGKLTPELIKYHLFGFGDQHHAQPKVISITQATELGTVYQPEEIKAIADLAHQNDMFLHVDGARLANAAASLNLSLKEITADLGIDVLSFGGTKNGLMFGEAVVFFNTSLARNFKYIRKQAMQLSSKMRFIAVQFETLLTDNLWLKNASHANKMAKLMEESVKDIPGVRITQKVEANGIFMILPQEIIPVLQEEFYFYVWDEKTSEVRLMCSFDTQSEDIRQFSAILRTTMSNK